MNFVNRFVQAPSNLVRIQRLAQALCMSREFRLHAHRYVLSAQSIALENNTPAKAENCDSTIGFTLLLFIQL